MLQRIKWYFIGLFAVTFCCIGTFIIFSEKQMEKISILQSSQLKKPKLNSRVEHTRKDVEKVLLQKEKQERITCRIRYPNSSLQFEPSPTGVQILEKMQHFQIWYEDPSLPIKSQGKQMRFFQGSQATYDFKKQSLFAANFLLSIYNTLFPHLLFPPKEEEVLFKGNGEDFSFFFQELKPCFSASHFNAQITYDKEER